MTEGRLRNWSLGIYLVAGIFYVLPAGGPQPADFWIVIVIVVLLFGRRIKIYRPDLPFFLFVCYSFLVSAVWSWVLSSPSMFLGAIYFLFNFLIYLVFENFIRSRTQEVGALIPFLLIALFFEAAYLLVFGGNSVREVGTFTNPNQMSYFSLCFTSLGLLVANHERKIMAGIFILMLGWVISLFGLSKAAMLAMAFQTIVFALLLEKGKLLFFIGLIFAATAFVILFSEQIDAGFARISMIGADDDDSLAGRGYDRIVNDIELVIFGAGEGEYWRHTSLWGGEIHSTFGTVLFCYGLPGFYLFVSFLWSVFKRNRLAFIIYIVPLLLYSLTHNGLRYTPFWICLAACASLGNRRNVYKMTRVV